MLKRHFLRMKRNRRRCYKNCWMGYEEYSTRFGRLNNLRARYKLCFRQQWKKLNESQSMKRKRNYL